VLRDGAGAGLEWLEPSHSPSPLSNGYADTNLLLGRFYPT